ncbi:lipoprotein chaperone [Pigmentiphaga humi]|uniref:Lipoprotein chaperone n=1 Tax=Pigmentiphaga humi TaxID=2478468 RepID=A0A3P4B502_9BURK|nr:outer membrane lipoprotein carrier protein LolA [Pigmentiphaga humi]VCU71374.1 lipoprotein chaperone [Pigmentiphaga humi]
MNRRTLLKAIMAAGIAACGPAHAFGLGELETQLRASPVVHGRFVQEKFLRSLPQPLTSRGEFTLATGKGLLWLLRKPIEQELRITADGIARRDERGQWTALPRQSGAGRAHGLMLSVLAGDTRELQENFDLALDGSPDAWRMTMTPNSPLLRQIFERIDIEGGRTIRRIELREAAGDRTVLKMEQVRTAPALTPEEARAYAE